MEAFESHNKLDVPNSEALGPDAPIASPLLQKLLQYPFPRLRSRTRSVDFYDCNSNNFVGLKIYYGVVDFEMRERHYGRYDCARSCAELEWMWQVPK